MSNNNEMTPEMLEEQADLLLAEAGEEGAPVKKDKATVVADLVELGRSKGKLTAQEIMDAMELFDFDPEQMDKLLDALREIEKEAAQ